MWAQLLKKATAQSSERGHLWHPPRPGERSPSTRLFPSEEGLALSPSYFWDQVSYEQYAAISRTRQFPGCCLVLLIPSFRQLRAVKPGSPLGAQRPPRRSAAPAARTVPRVGAAPAPATAASRPGPSCPQHCSGKRKAPPAPLRPWERPGLRPVLQRPIAQGGKASATPRSASAL